MNPGDIFLRLLNISITASWLILAVLCIRLVFRKIPKWVICLLWGAVAIRLICPFSIESPLSILPSAEPVKSSDYIPSIDSRLTIVRNTINPMLMETFAYKESDSAAPLQIVTYAAGVIWVCGMILFIICAMASMLQLHKLVEEAVCVRNPIYICDAVRSPFILGIIRPRVYLPSALSEWEMDYIIAHESAHLKRKDHWWKPLGYLLLCIYWFNPLCWAAYAMLCKDIELACDEKAADKMTLSERKEYSKILLSCANQKRAVMVCPLAFGEVGVRERVQSVLHYKKPAFWIVLLSVAACLTAAVYFFTTSPKTYQVKITVPADGTEHFYYSDTEISPKGNTLTLYAGDGMGDGEVALLPIEVSGETAYEPTYITPGMPVKMDVEKGAWYKIGVVSMRNTSGEDMEVYLSVENVDLRIAAADDTNAQENRTLSVKEAEELLQRQLSTTDHWNENYRLEPINATAETAGNKKVYRFEIRYQESIEQVSDRLVGNYTVTVDGNTVYGTVYWYDPANDEYIPSEEATRQDTVLLDSDETTTTENDTAQEILLYEQPEADKVCIQVQPSMIREQTFYYYIPTGTDQEWLSAQIQALDLEGEPLNKRWEGHRERGWQIIYNDIEIRVFEEGYLYYTYNDDITGMMECLIEAPKLCDYIQILLMEKTGYQKDALSEIKDIVSAKLDVKSIQTNWQLYSQTITDTETLQKFEEWFRNAEYIPFGTDCGNRCACLELTLANGNVVRLSMATDSCPNFSLDGVAYDYRPVTDWNNSEFFKYFDEIPSWED